MIGQCARCDTPARLFRFLRQTGAVASVCARCHDSLTGARPRGSWGSGSDWAKTKVPVSWLRSTLPSGPRGRR